MNLKEIYLENRDILHSEIPLEFIESFKKFMYGSTYTLNIINGVEEPLYFATDFGRWYRSNQLLIERDIIINEIIKK